MSPRSLVRMAGVCQLLEAITAIFGQVIVLGRLIVSGNAAATATNILGLSHADANSYTYAEADAHASTIVFIASDGSKAAYSSLAVFAAGSGPWTPVPLSESNSDAQAKTIGHPVDSRTICPTDTARSISCSVWPVGGRSQQLRQSALTPSMFVLGRTADSLRARFAEKPNSRTLGHMNRASGGNFNWQFDGLSRSKSPLS